MEDRIDIKCFGIAKDIVDGEKFSINASGLSILELKDAINSKYPNFNKIKAYMIAVNQRYAADSYVVSAGDEIAIIPPVSGG